MLDLPKDRDIAAILPLYTQRGDCTCLYLRSGSRRIYNVKVRAVLEALAHRRCKDVARLRAWSCRRTAQKLWAPLPVGVEMVLAPFKVRRPRVHGDETVGCVNVSQVQEVAAPLVAVGTENRAEKKSRQSRAALLALRSGVRIPVLWSAATTRKHLQAARLIHSVLLNELDEVFLHRLSHPDV